MAVHAAFCFPTLREFVFLLFSGWYCFRTIADCLYIYKYAIISRNNDSKVFTGCLIQKNACHFDDGSLTVNNGIEHDLTACIVPHASRSDDRINTCIPISLREIYVIYACLTAVTS